LSESARTPDHEVKRSKTAVQVLVAERPAEVEVNEVEVNERGFMQDLSQWTPQAAEELARHQGLPRELDGLSPDHWRVIDFLRSHFHRTGATPSVPEVCGSLMLTKRQFFSLFPNGLLMARRVAGLPGPRRTANGTAPSPSQQVLAGNWWLRLTR